MKILLPVLEMCQISKYHFDFLSTLYLLSFFVLVPSVSLGCSYGDGQ